MSLADSLIESKGREIFSMIPGGGIGATALGKILRTKHKTSQNEASKLTHPTVVTTLGLDLLQHPHRYSKYAHSYMKHMHDVVNGFKMYLVGTAAKSVENIVSIDGLDALDLQNYQDFEDEVVAETGDDIMDYFHEIDFFKRVDVIANKFEYAFSTAMVLGFCPCLIEQNARVPFPAPMRGVSEVASTLDRFLLTLETGLKRTHMLTIDEIMTDLIVTERFGAIKATLASKPNYKIVELNFSRMFGGSGVVDFLTGTTGGSLSKMMQHEIKYSFARNESDNFNLERMRKTQFVIGSELSSEAQTILSGTIKEKFENSSPGQILQGLKKAEKGEEEMKELDDKARVLEAQSAKMMERIADYVKNKTDNLTDRAIRMEAQDQTVENARRIQKIIEKGEINAVRAERERARHPLEPEAPEDVFGNEPSTFGLVARGSKQHKREEEVILKSRQDKEVRRERDNLSKQLLAKRMECDLLREEADKLLVKNNAMDKKKATMDLELKTREEKEKAMVKIINEKDKLVEDLKKQMGKMTEYVGKAANSLRLSEKDRKKMLTLVSDIRRGSDFLSAHERKAIFSDELDHFFQNFGILSQEVNAALNRRDFTHMAYEQVLAEECVRPTPIFDRVQTKRHLAMVNEWVEFPWMRDSWVNDAVKQKEDEDSGAVLVHAADEIAEEEEGPITDSKELYVINVNPISTKDAKQINKYIHDQIDISTNTPTVSNRFMSVKFKSVAQVRESLEISCKDSWESYVQTTFMLGRERISVVGHKIPPRITPRTLVFYTKPFMKIFEGDENLSTEIMEDIINVITLEDDPGQVSGLRSLSNRIVRRVIKPYISREVRKVRRSFLKRSRERKQLPIQQEQLPQLSEQQQQRYAFFRL